MAEEEVAVVMVGNGKKQSRRATPSRKAVKPSPNINVCVLSTSSKSRHWWVNTMYLWCWVYFIFFLSFPFLGLHLQQVEVPRLGVESELQLPASTTATAMQDPSCACDLHQSSQLRWILNPLSEVRDQTCIPMDASQVCYHWAMTGSPGINFLKFLVEFIQETILALWFLFSKVINY